MRKTLCCSMFGIFFVMLMTFSIGVVYAGPCELPQFDPDNFNDSLTIDNLYFPLVPGTTFVYEPVPNEDNGVNTMKVLYADEENGTKTILGINCVVVHDYETVNGVLSEDTLDWYAQDDAGNIWYFGEATKKCLCVDDCESEECIDRTGSWEAGVDGALPGYLILDPEPKPGVCYQQESAQGAQDMAKVLRLNAKVILGNGESYTDCLETKEWSALEPGVIEHKYYAPGVGLVLIEELKGKTGRVELIDKYFEEN